MSNCGYFNIFKGKLSCKHPNYGEMNTKSYAKNLGEGCKYCKKRCGGIYPSQIPKVDQTGWKYEVVDVNGKVLMNY